MTATATVGFGTSSQLPADMSADALQALTQAGVVFRGNNADDPAFVDIALPKGWRKTDTDLLDEQGHRRATFRLGGTLGDNWSTVALVRRFDVYFGVGSGSIVAVVADVGEAIYCSRAQPFSDDWSPEDWCSFDAVRDDAWRWLNERYTDWRNPAAYWD